MTTLPDPTKMDADLRCVVNHTSAADRNAPPCHGPATHWIKHETWKGLWLPTCREVAHSAAGKPGWSVVSFDAMRASLEYDGRLS